MKKSCGEEEGRKKALKIFQCVNKQKVDEIQACSVGSLDVLKQLSESDEDKATLTAKMCCLAHATAACTGARLEGVTCTDPSLNPKAHIEGVLRSLQEGNCLPLKRNLK